MKKLWTDTGMNFDAQCCLLSTVRKLFKGHIWLDRSIFLTIFVQESWPLTLHEYTCSFIRPCMRPDKSCHAQAYSSQWYTESTTCHEKTRKTMQTSHKHLFGKYTHTGKQWYIKLYCCLTLYICSIFFAWCWNGCNSCIFLINFAETPYLFPTCSSRCSTSLTSHDYYSLRS